MATTKKGQFKCDKCKGKVDTLYFVGNKELCEVCKKEVEGGKA